MRRRPAVTLTKPRRSRPCRSAPAARERLAPKTETADREREAAPFYWNQISADRIRVAEIAALVDGQAATSAGSGHVGLRRCRDARPGRFARAHRVRGVRLSPARGDAAAACRRKDCRVQRQPARAGTGHEQEFSSRRLLPGKARHSSVLRDEATGQSEETPMSEAMRVDAIRGPCRVRADPETGPPVGQPETPQGQVSLQLDRMFAASSDPAARNQRKRRPAH